MTTSLLTSTNTPNRITFYRGDTHSVIVTVKKRDPTDATGKRLLIQDVSGGSFRLTVKRRGQDATVLVQKAGALVNTGTDGQIKFNFEPADTASLPTAYPYVYDVEIQLPVGKVYTVLRDVLDLKEDVTT